MWLALGDSYTDLKALSGKINLSQGTGHGRILAPFMYKVYVNGLLNMLSNNCYATLILSLVDDISWLTLHPSFLKTSMYICNRYGINRRYNSSLSKIGIITFGETKLQHFESLKSLEWFLGDTKVKELYEYRYLGVFKIYVGSFSSNIDDNIDKTSWYDIFFQFRSSESESTYFWRQASLPTLLFGAELFTLTPTLLLRLERCQSGFSKIFSIFLSLHLVLYFKSCWV